MREEYELEVLEKYDIEVKSTRRIRGAFFCIGSELKSGRVGDFGDCLQSRSVRKCPLIIFLFGSRARKNAGTPIVNILINDT